MTQIKFFRIIYIFLLITYFVFNYYQISEWIFRNNLSNAQDKEIKGLTTKSFSNEEFIIEEGEVIEAGIRKIENINYINDSEDSKKLDLYLPETMYSEQKYPLLLYIHGGAWLEGTKDYFHDFVFIENGYIVASIDYRLSTEDIFPAQIHDIKAALRWLKANASKYNIDADNIGVYGESAGGHLASLMGTTPEEDQLNGDIGQNLDENVKVKAVINEYGLLNFETIEEQCRNNEMCESLYNERDSIVSKLLGCKVDQCTDELKFASPINHITSDAADFLHFHGKKDTIVPFEQTEEFHDELIKNNVYSETIISEEGVHIDGDERNKNTTNMLDFFDWKLKEFKYPFCAYDITQEQIFEDVSLDDNNLNEINTLACLHAYNGIASKNLEPQKEITRVEIARMLNILFKIDTSLSCEEFEDVSKYDRNYLFIKSLRCNDISKGYKDNTFAPDNKIDAIELLTMISRIKGISLEAAKEKVNFKITEENLSKQEASVIIYQFLDI